MANPLVVRRNGDCFRFTLTLSDPAAAPGDIAALSEAVSPFLADSRVSPAVTAAIHTALEELLTNLAKFGHPRDFLSESEILAAEGEIRIDAHGVELRLIDNGVEFDPTRQPTPAFTDDPEQLVPGGLGLHMLRTMFLSYSHKRENGKNIGVWRI